VHHASNKEYLDKNFGGVLILFDRLFGTYAPERADMPIKYGLVGHAPSHNPFIIALGEWRDIMRDVVKARTWRERYQLAFGRPGWHAKPSS